MTKLQDRSSQQLELRLLSDLKAKPEVSKANDAEVKRDAQPASTNAGASEHDMSVYRKIASNYFDSLRKE
jgi:hypothetical protein